MSESGGSIENVFRQVKRQVPIERYFEEVHGRDLRPEGAGRLACVCPWHDEKTPSLKIFEDGTFRCFGACDIGGTVIDATMKSEDFDLPVDAVKWLNDHFKLGITFDNKYYKEFTAKIEKAKEQLAAGQTEMDDPNSQVARIAREYLAGRGYVQDTIEHFRLSVNKKENRLLIPITEKGGHLWAWSGRALFDRMDCPKCGQAVSAETLNDQRETRYKEWAASVDAQTRDNTPSWRLPEAVQAGQTCPHCHERSFPVFMASQHPKYRDATGYRKGENWYHLAEARKALREQKDPKEQQPILVMEGFADVWACYQAGYPGAVAYNGSTITGGQASELVALAKRLNRWIGIIPDWDSTGRRQLNENIKALKTADPAIEVRVLHGLDTLQCPGKDGQMRGCKDAGEILQFHGEARLREFLEESWWGADEYRIRQVVTGSWSKNQQIELVNDILSEARHTIALDEIVPLLAETWETQESVVRTFFHSKTARGSAMMDSARIIATIDDAQLAAEEYLKESFVITTDYDQVNEALPGGGFRLGQLSMVLGKCLAGHSLVRLADGSETEIREVHRRVSAGEDLWVCAVDERDGSVVPRQVGRTVASGVKAVLRVVAATGETLEATAEHQFLTTRGWMRLGEITDRVAQRRAPHLLVVDPGTSVARQVAIREIAPVGETETFDLSVLGSEYERSLIANGIVVHNSGTGKAQPLSADVLTPTGYTKLGDIELGDKVVNPDGGTANVVGIYPQGIRDIYKVTLSDGSVIEADLEHIFHVTTASWAHLGKPPRNMTLKDIVAAGLQRDNDGGNKWFIPMVSSDIDLGTGVPEDAPIIPPYSLGALLGDGAIGTKAVRLTSDDPEIVDRVRDEVAGIACLKESTSANDAKSHMKFQVVGSTGARNGVLDAVRKLGLAGTRSDTKFVPHEYLFTTAQNRLELLRGLMDTDGTIWTQGGTGRVCYYTTSKQLAEDVRFLVQSLGGLARTSLNESNSFEGVVGKPLWRLHISMPPGVNPFHLPRKANQYNRVYRVSRSIVSVEFSHREQAQCIMLDSENHQYITNDWVRLHNTTLVLNHLWQFLRRQQLPCIFFSLEQPKAQVYLSIVQIALGITGKEAEELVRSKDPRLDEVNRIFANLTIVDNVPDDQGAAQPMTPQRVEQLIHEINILKGGEPTKVVAIDHLGIIKPGDQAPRGIQDSDSAAAGWCMEKFFHICKSTKTFFLVLQQLPKEVPPGEPFGYDAGRGASQQTDYCDYIICIWRPEQKKDLTEEEKVAKAGSYVYMLSKNRHGPAGVPAYLTFDHKRRRIVPESAMGIPAAFMPDSAGTQFQNTDLFGDPDMPIIDAPTGPPVDDMFANDEISDSTPAPAEEHPYGDIEPGDDNTLPADLPDWYST